MLLLLALANLFARSSSVSANSLESRDEGASCDDINSCRTLFGIVSGCLATIFACTWVSVHPNVPAPDQGNLALSWRRFRMMLVGVIAPELMVGFATRQFLDARWFSKEYDVSLTHGFFFAMGGFVSQSGHHPIVKISQLHRHPEYLTAIQRIRIGDIEDKSKGDSLSKGVILLQGLWFTAQCLARVQQHLPLTELEVATLAFQFVNIFIWLLWWRKPLDAQHPILLRVHTAARFWPDTGILMGNNSLMRLAGFSKRELLPISIPVSRQYPAAVYTLRPADELTERRHDPQRNPSQLTTMTTDGAEPEPSWDSTVFNPVASTSVLPSFSTHGNELPAGVKGRHSLLHTNWQTWWRKETWDNLWLALCSTICQLIDGNYSDFDPESSISVPSFWSMGGPYNRNIGVMPAPYGLNECVMGTIFGAIHCVAWNATFPSTPEMLMWRSCSLVVAALPFLMTLFGNLLAQLFGRTTLQELVGDSTIDVAYVFTVIISISTYIVARLVLIVLSFTTLRALPPDTFVDVNWSTYIPHL